MNKIVLVSSWSLVSIGQLIAAESPTLNLLFIIVADMNADSSGWMGSTMGATPVVDVLAAK